MHLDLIYTVWNTLSTVDEWNKFDTKIMMIAFVNPETNQKIYIQKNIAITKDMTAFDYSQSVKKILAAYWDVGSFENKEDYTYIVVEFSPVLQNNRAKTVYTKLRNLNSIGKRQYSTSTINKSDGRWYIKPLKNSNISRTKVICSLDVETMKLNDDVQIPVAISFAYFLNGTINSFVVLIDHTQLRIDSKLAVLNMWKSFYDKIKELKPLRGRELIVYSHNLGSFDGYFILPSLLNYTDQLNSVEPLIDDKNKFISITYKYSEFPYINMSEEELSSRGIYEEDAKYKKLIISEIF